MTPHAGAHTRMGRYTFYAARSGTSVTETAIMNPAHTACQLTSDLARLRRLARKLDGQR